MLLFWEKIVKIWKSFENFITILKVVLKKNMKF